MKRSIPFYSRITNVRSLNIINNILGSGGLKIINILSTLIVVPMTINYINGERYGLWLTMSSIVAWMSYFDFGFGHGFRNRFAEALAKDDTCLCRKLVSTTYVSLIAIFGSILIILLAINVWLDWTAILNVNKAFRNELSIVFMLMAFALCSNCVVNNFNMLLTACQRTAVASVVQTCSQLSGLIGVLFVTKFINPGLISLTIAYTIIPSLILLVISLYSFTFTSYKVYAPSIRYFSKELIHDIVGLGAKFFVIMLATLVIFQCINLIVSRVLGPLEVTRYNIVYKYFNIANMFSVIVLVPFWSAFTEAYVKKDFVWMRDMLRKLELFGLLLAIGVVIMIFMAQTVLKIWIGNTVTVPFSTVILVGIYVMILNTGGIYMYLINGIGKISLQMYLYIGFAIMSLPSMLILGDLLGLKGIMAVPILVYLIQTIISRIQLKRIIKGTARGVWNL